MRASTFAAFLLVATSLRLSADVVVSATGSGYFTEADSGGIDLTVNPDGSVTINNEQDFSGGFSADFNAPSFGSAGGTGQLMLPSLPDDAIINWETLTFSASATTVGGPGFSSLTVGPQGPINITSVSLDTCTGTCTWNTASGTVPITLPLPIGGDATAYGLSVSGTDGGGLVYTVPSTPGEYFGDENIEVLANWEIDVDYSEAPEPGFIAPVALGMIAFIAVKGRKRLQRVTS